jgi:hypothetical protein
MHIPRICVLTMQLDIMCYILEVQFQFRSICGICGGHNVSRVGFYSNILIYLAIHNLISVLYYLSATHLEFRDCVSQPALNQFFTCHITLGWTEIRHVRFQHISERNCCGFSDADLLSYILMFIPLPSLLNTHVCYLLRETGFVFC